MFGSILMGSMASSSTLPDGCGAVASPRSPVSARTSYGGVYRNAAGQTITVNPKSGVGDVVAEAGNEIISAECKGGIINTRHPGQVSRLYKGLCETVGMLMATPSLGRQVAVVPLTDGTRRLAERLAPRCAMAGIEIALVGSRGEVVDVRHAAS